MFANVVFAVNTCAQICETHIAQVCDAYKEHHAGGLDGGQVNNYSTIIWQHLTIFDNILQYFTIFDNILKYLPIIWLYLAILRNI